MYLIDTNVISEARKGKRANSGVIQFFRATPATERYLAVQTIGEIRRGVENIRRRGDQLQALQLEAWLNAVVVEYGARILSFDVDCAQVWGRLTAPQASQLIDKQIAAIALIYQLRIVTRNVQDFSSTSVELLNPFV
ncbi:type II toxin-antitoxin system VapC family toxin [Pseudoduganella sp. OTU4001]|uniref:type II toxin-antitoxin system VapC family toxin n=1 Tax=Pseudoduganella sp. OTU4001 TaxID=3043854 RepID=UPI00313D5A98